MADTFIADLQDSIEEAKLNPSGKGTMVALYGTLLPPLEDTLCPC